MTFKITYESDDIIVVNYSGNVDLQERLEAVDEVVKLVNQAVITKLLIDIRHINSLMDAEQQQFFGNHLANTPQLKNARVAVLSKNMTHDSNLIINNTAYLQGYHVAPFDNRKEALLWLNYTIR